MKCWLSSLDRKTLDPTVSLLMSAISWPQSPNCKASTLDTRKHVREKLYGGSEHMWGSSYVITHSPIWKIPTALSAGPWLAPCTGWFAPHRRPAVNCKFLRRVVRGAVAAVGLFPAASYLSWAPLGHRCGEKKLSQVHQETNLLFINSSQRRQHTNQYFTFWFASRQVISTRRHGHLYGCRRCNDGPVVVVMETDALLFGRGEDSAGHYLCSFLDLIQQWVTAGWKGKETEIKKVQEIYKDGFDWICVSVTLSPVPCFPGL